jgi:tetratricopeptide (TPR) repeat protein
MRKLVLLVLPLVFLSASEELVAQRGRSAGSRSASQDRGQDRSQGKGQSAPGQATRSEITQRLQGRQAPDELGAALRLAKTGNYPEASVRLFQLGLSPRFATKRNQIRYLLGLMLYQMKLNQVAAFQFISVIRTGDPKYLQQSLEKLSLAADALGDETLLNYAISRVKAESFPTAQRDMLFYRIGEFQLRNQSFDGAIRSLNQVAEGSPFYDRAHYLMGLAYAQANDPRRAAMVFENLLQKNQNRPVTDTVRVAAQMGKARALYQMKQWDDSIEAYREVPRDTDFWHDTLFESSWAMMRSGRFRSALSNFQSLHSPYYEETYLPESLLLRSIVYLYICQYDEMEKVIDLFARVYRPVFKDLSAYAKTDKTASKVFADVVKVLVEGEKPGFDAKKARLPLPVVAVRKVVREGDFQRSYEYIKNLLRERKTIQALPAGWKTSGLGRYSLKTIERRSQRARAKAGRQVQAHFASIRTELIDLFEQQDFLRYEMLNAKKEQLKKKVAGKDLPESQVNEETERDFYIQNGYQYWTFRGEYWLDEIGNYHYVGTPSCQ